MLVPLGRSMRPDLQGRQKGGSATHMFFICSI
jgi:hypothetical protein